MLDECCAAYVGWECKFGPDYMLVHMGVRAWMHQQISCLCLNRFTINDCILCYMSGWVFLYVVLSRSLAHVVPMCTVGVSTAKTAGRSLGKSKITVGR